MRQELLEYMKKNKEGMAESHLDGWFNSEYKGLDSEEIKAKIIYQHDNSLMIEELEGEFGEITKNEESAFIEIFAAEVVKNIKFGGACGWFDTIGNLN